MVVLLMLGNIVKEQGGINEKKNIKDTVEIEKIIKPIYNFKANE